MICSIIKKVVV